jgi:transaldolase
MKFFADTASTSEIEYCFSRGVNDGITTNPKIMEATGDLSKGFIEACKTIVNKYPNVPVSLETDLRGIDMNNFENQDYKKIEHILLKQAYEIAKLGKNVVVKIPVCWGGLIAAKKLAEKNIKTNITACMSPYQALTAAKYGNGYVSLFANRMLDSHIIELAGYNLEEIVTNPNWKEIVKQNKEKYFDKAWEITLNEIAYTAKNMEGTNCELIIGSIRTPEDIFRIISAKPQIITIPTKIVEGLEKIEELKEMGKNLKDRIYTSMNHPMTTYTLKEFEESANAYRK